MFTSTIIYTRICSRQLGLYVTDFNVCQFIFINVSCAFYYWACLPLGLELDGGVDDPVYDDSNFL